MIKNIIIIFIILISIFVLLTYLKLHLLYHPIKQSSIKHEYFIKKLRELTDRDDNVITNKIKTSDGILLDTVFIKKSDSNNCIIYFHGNYGNISMRSDMIKFLYNFASVVIFDYRSFGYSSGDRYLLSCDNLQIDAKTIWNYTTTQLHFEPNNISLFGESLGCSIAVYLASYLSRTFNSNFYPRAVILNSPFYSFSSMIKHTLDNIGLGFITSVINILIGFEYQSNVEIKKINYITKTIIAHSENDEVIPYSQAVDLYNCISQKNKNSIFIKINGTHDNPEITDRYMYLIAEIFS